MSNKIIRIILILVAAGVVGLLAYNKVNKDDKLAGERKAMGARSSSLLVDGYLVSPAPLQSEISATGTLLSNESIQVQPQTSGRVTQLFIQDGASVKKGQLLATLYAGDLQAQLEKAKLQRVLADTVLTRQKQLLTINGISRQDVDNTENQVAAAQADVDYYESQISETRIIAPFNGKLGLRQISVGAIVSPTTVITTLYQNNPLKLEFSVPEKYATQIKLGDEVIFSVAEQPNHSFSGKVYALNPGIDPQTRTMTMRARVDNTAGKLSPGGFAIVKIQLHTILDALMIPNASLIPTTQDAQVILCKDGKAHFVTVKTGVRTPDKIQIISGVNAGDTILTTGIMQASEGAPLHVRNVAHN